MKQKKIVSILLVTVLMVTLFSVIGGTLAFLIAETEPIVNTFELGDITYELVLMPNLPDGYTENDVTMPTLDPESPCSKAAGSVEFTLSGDPVLTGYKFLGWYADEEGETPVQEADTTTIEVEYNGDTSHTVTNGDKVTMTLYAQWNRDTYTVKYDANGGTGHMDDQIFNYDEKDFLRKNTFTRVGYDFVGWAVDQSSTTADYTDQEYVSNLTDKNEITLYAVWGKDQIIVTFESGYADSPAVPRQKLVTFDEPYGELATAEIEGYRFLGWYTEREGKGTHITVNTTVTNPDNHTLYAYWETPDIDLLLMFEGSGTNNFTTFAKHDYEYEKAITYTGQTWQGKWESFSIRMANLVVGGTYQLKFDAAFSDRTCIRDREQTYPIGCKVDDHPHYAESGSTETYTWVPTSQNKSTKGYVIEFVATEDTMFWLWELSKIRNPGEIYKPDWVSGVENFEESYFDLILDNISLTLIDAYFDFEETTARTTNDAGVNKGSFTLNSYGEGTVNFNYTGAGGVYEKARIPINCLIVGETYTVDFTLKTDAKDGGGNNTNFKSSISTSPTLSNSYNDSGTQVFEQVVEGTVTGSFSFKATNSIMYWIWNMTGVANEKNYNYEIDATIKYDPSAAPTVYTDRETSEPDLPDYVIRGEESFLITEMPDMTDLEASVALEGMELYGWWVESDFGTMMFDSTVALEEELSIIYEGGEYFELWLTPLYVEAEDEIVFDEPEGEIIIEDAEPEDEIILGDEGEEPAEIPVEFELTGIIAETQDAPVVGTDYVVALTPEEGYILPETISVYIDGETYIVDVDTETNLLTIPGDLITDQTAEIIIAAEAVEFVEEDFADETPADEDPVDEDPVVEDPADEDPVVEDPADEEDYVDEDSSGEEPVVEVPADGDPVGQESNEEPIIEVEPENGDSAEGAPAEGEFEPEEGDR